MFQFGSNEPFAALGGDGTAYASDPALPNVQVVFPSKTAASGADPTTPVMVDFGFGERGRQLPSVDPDGMGFLGGYDEIFPGAAAAAIPLLNGELFARAHWPSDPNALESYTCNQPGYFTTMEAERGPDRIDRPIRAGRMRRQRPIPRSGFLRRDARPSANRDRPSLGRWCRHRSERPSSIRCRTSVRSSPWPRSEVPRQPDGGAHLNGTSMRHRRR